MKHKISRLVTLIALLLVCVLQVGCASKFEYKVLTVSGKASDAMDSSKADVSDDYLNNLGKDGWDLATSYVEPETVYPNFGKEDYHTGIKSNTRTKQVVLIFKRRR